MRSLYWAWGWALLFAVVGWAPALGMAYICALVVYAATGFTGPIVMWLAYAALFGVGLFGIGQVRDFLELNGQVAKAFTYGAGSLLLGSWALAAVLVTLTFW